MPRYFVKYWTTQIELEIVNTTIALFRCLWHQNLKSKVLLAFLIIANPETQTGIHLSDIIHRRVPSTNPVLKLDNAIASVGEVVYGVCVRMMCVEISANVIDVVLDRRLDAFRRVRHRRQATRHVREVHVSFVDGSTTSAIANFDVILSTFCIENLTDTVWQRPPCSSDCIYLVSIYSN